MGDGGRVDAPPPGPLRGRRPRPGGPVRTAAPEAPTATVLAAFLGAMMIMVEAFVLLAGGSEPFGLALPANPAQAEELGGIGLAIGVAVVAVLFGLQENLGQRFTAGLLLVVLGLASVVSGGGFGVGLLLTVLAGVGAVARPPSTLYGTPRRATRQPPPSRR